MYGSGAAPPAAPRSNLRAWVFFPLFLIACGASLVYVFSRPPIYLSTARLQLEAGKPASGDAVDLSHVLGAAQTLTSSAVMEDVYKRVTGANAEAAHAIGSAQALRAMLDVVPVAGTNVIELRGEGDNPRLLQRILSAWIEAYRDSHRQAFDQSSRAALEETRSMVHQLKQNLSEKRRDMDAFRKKYDIVSLEREENQVMSQLKGLNSALNDARAKEANAEARLLATQENVAAGKPGERPRDQAIIANLERRANELRERARDFEHDYTAQYLAMDPKYKALRANLARIEQQIESERKTSGEQALRSAEEDVTASRETTQRLQQQLATRKRDIQEFTTRFAEHTALASELRRVEESYNAAKERLDTLEIGHKAARPLVAVLSATSIPERPLRPDYWRDALLAIAGCGLLGLIAVWFVEFFRRSGVPQPVAVTQPIIQIAYTPSDQPVATIPALGMPAPRLLETPPRLPRELSGPEVHALWHAATPAAQVVIAALLSGLSLEALSALRYDDVDLERGLIHTRVGGAGSYLLREPLKQLLSERRTSSGGQREVAAQDGISLDDAEALIACAACDAGLAQPAEVDSGVLRHTYFAYLARQGARLSDIGRLIGHIAPAVLREYGRLSPPGPGIALEQINPVLPALRAQGS